MNTTVFSIFDETGGGIGRSSSNLFVLTDKNNFISLFHAEIEFREGNYGIKDISKNGVLINGNTKPLGKGNFYILKENDNIFIGKYLISVIFETRPKPKGTRRPRVFAKIDQNVSCNVF